MIGSEYWDLAGGGDLVFKYILCVAYTRGLRYFWNYHCSAWQAVLSFNQ